MEAQVIKCKCGSVVAMCRIPEAYEDTDWMKEVRNCSKKGYSISVGKVENFKLEMCCCGNKGQMALAV